jgi:hypothetical protein
MILNLVVQAGHDCMLSPSLPSCVWRARAMNDTQTFSNHGMTAGILITWGMIVELSLRDGPILSLGCEKNSQEFISAT